MMTMFDDNTRIIDLTVGDLREILAQERKENVQPAPQKERKNYEYGIHGIASIFNCSMTTANRIKKSGVIDEAIIQNGRIIMTDVEKAVQLFNKNKDFRTTL